MLKREGLYDIISLTPQELHKRLVARLQNLGYLVSEKPGYFIAAFPPEPHSRKVALVAHLDTIARPRGVMLVSDGTNLKNEKGVLGADDRAGVFAILEIIRRGYRPVIIFGDQEEKGMIGAKDLGREKWLEKWMEPVSLMIELDRANSNDFVFYHSEELPAVAREMIEKSRFVEASGSFSDVDALTDATNIPHVNLSVGYYNQHTPSEFLVFSELESTIDRLEDILERESSLPEGLRLDPKTRRGSDRFSFGSFGWSGGWEKNFYWGSNVTDLEDYKIERLIRANLDSAGDVGGTLDIDDIDSEDWLTELDMREKKLRREYGSDDIPCDICGVDAVTVEDEVFLCSYCESRFKSEMTQ